jgi:hypothetical protein
MIFSCGSTAGVPHSLIVALYAELSATTFQSASTMSRIVGPGLVAAGRLSWDTTQPSAVTTNENLRGAPMKATRLATCRTS